MQTNIDLSGPNEHRPIRSRLLGVVRFRAPLSVEVHALCVLTSVTSTQGVGRREDQRQDETTTKSCSNTSEASVGSSKTEASRWRKQQVDEQ